LSGAVSREQQAMQGFDTVFFQDIELLARIEDIERSRQAEQLRLDSVKTLGERNRLGQFATSFPLALDIARYVRTICGDRHDPIRFLEPAIGTGVFYSALRETFPVDRIEESKGLEIDPLLAEAAESLWQDTGLSVSNRDFTKLEPPSPRDRYNLILTNPPYVRHHHVSREDKARLKAAVAEHLRIDISGLAGLYCHFLLLADRWLRDGGLAAWLIPAEFMDVNYGVAVKQYLAENVTLCRIHRFCPLDVQFGDALVTSAVVVFAKGPAEPGHSVELSFGGSLLAPNTSESVPLVQLCTTKKWTAYPSLEDHRKSQGPTLGDFFSIKRGLATGSNSFFILDRGDAIRRGIPPEFLRPILPSSRHLRENVIESDPDGYPKLERSLALLDCDLPEEDVKERFPEFWRYLASGKQQEIHHGYLTSRRSPWYAQETREPAPFLCTYMGRKKADGNPFRFFWNKSAAIAANVFLLLYPRGPLKQALQSRPELYPLVFEFLKDIKPDHLIGEGRVYGGGLHKMEPKELASLPAGSLAQALGIQPRPAEKLGRLF
jgi:hypothetical protein